MLLAGDEIGHTPARQQQRLLPGQRNQLARLEFGRSAEQKLLEFVRRLIAIYHEEPTLPSPPLLPRQVAARRTVARNRLARSNRQADVGRSRGTPATSAALACTHGRPIDVDEYGTPIIGDHMLILFNADHEQTIPFALPKLKESGPWERLFDTALDTADIVEGPKKQGEEIVGTYKMLPCSMVVFRALCLPKATD